MTLPTAIKAIKPSDLEGEPIPDHDGLPVTSTVAAIMKTGDGLSESMGMAPIHIPVGEHVLVLIVAKARGHKYERTIEGTGKDVKTLDEFTETLVLDAESALFLDPDLVGAIVSEHLSRVAKSRSDAEARKAAAAKGKKAFQLPLPDGADGAVDPDMEAHDGSAAEPNADGGSHLASVPDDDEDHPDGMDADAKAPWDREGATV